MDNTMILILTSLPFIIILILFLNRLTQSVNDYKDAIVNDLNKHDCELIDINLPKVFDSGPFPFIKISLFRKSSGAKLISGDKTCYRIVKFKSGDGAVHQSWVKIEVKYFVVDNVKWIPSLLSE